jgi:hypothetical protein
MERVDQGMTKSKRPQKSKNKWINLTAETIEQANQQSLALSVSQIASQIYIQYLMLTQEQNNVLSEIYQSSDGIKDKVFDPEEEPDQFAATAILAANYLDLDSRESLGSHWSVRWGNTCGKDALKFKKVLYQWYVISNR